MQSQKTSPSTPLRLACAAAILVATAASATDVDASITGLMQVRPTIVNAEDRSYVPFIALIGLRVADQNVWKLDEVRAELGAWGRLSVLSLGDNAADVDLAYVGIKAFDKHLAVNLGRQFVTGGAVRAMQLDGLSATVTIPGNVGLSAFGGVPVIPRFALARGSATWGGRLFWRPTWETEIGASYFELWDRPEFTTGASEVSRRDVGLDFRTFLFSHLSLSGLGVFSVPETRFSELTLNARVMLPAEFEITGAFRHTSPDLFLPRTSIFAVFAETNRTEGALGLDWNGHAWSAGVDGRVIGFEDGLGYEVTGVVGFRPGRNTRTSLQVIRLADPGNAYTRARLAARHSIGQLTLAADVDGALFDNPINGRTVALQGQLTAKLGLPANFDVLVSGLAATDPLFTQRFEVLARLVYTFQLHTGGAR